MRKIKLLLLFVTLFFGVTIGAYGVGAAMQLGIPEIPSVVLGGAIIVAFLYITRNAWRE